MRRRGRPHRWSLELFGAAYERLTQDNGDGLAASLAFGALLSMAPLLLVVLSVTSLVLGEGTTRREIRHLVAESLGTHAVTLVTGWIDDARAWSGSATLVGLVVFVIGSARLVMFIDGAFRVIFEQPPSSRRGLRAALHDYVSTQLKTLAVTFAAGALMATSLTMRAIGEWLVGDRATPLISALWWLGREALSFGVWTAALALIYWALPPIRLERSEILTGALVSAGLVEATLLVLRGITRFVDFGAAYGAASAIIGTVFTLYLVSQLFLFGAEITAELAARRGQHLRSALDGAPERVMPPHREAGGDTPSR